MNLLTRPAHWIIRFVVLICLAGCTKPPLEVYSEYLGIEQYASYHVNSPDPCLFCPEIGQQLIIKWNIPHEYLCYPDLKIIIIVRLQNGEERQAEILCERASGETAWKIIRREYLETGGISTYKVELYSGEIPLISTQHSLWNETIQLNIDLDAEE